MIFIGNGYYYEDDEMKIYNCINDSSLPECIAVNNNGYYIMKNDDIISCYKNVCENIHSLPLKANYNIFEENCAKNNEYKYGIDYLNNEIYSKYFCINSNTIILPSEGEPLSLISLDIDTNKYNDSIPFDIENNKLILSISSNSIIQIDLSIGK